jgi:hypothetical protein
MAVTLAGGLTIVPEEFLPHVVEYSTKKSALVAAGIIDTDPVFDAKAKEGGTLITMPFWKDVDQDSQVIDDTADTTVYAIDQSGDVAVKLMRENAWGASDLAAALAGDDPVDALASMIGGYWAREEQRILIAILNGIFLANAADNSSDLIYDVHEADVTANGTTPLNFMNGETIIDGKAKLGDAHDKLTALCMHSVPYHNMEKSGLIEYVQTTNSDGTSSVQVGAPNQTARGIPTVFGRRIIVDDTCPVANVTGGKAYTSYLFGQGAIARGEGAPKVPFETERTAKRGITEIFHRRHFILHPRGIKFTNTTVTKETPSNANLALAANWSRVWDAKNIRIVKMVTNG